MLQKMFKPGDKVRAKGNDGIMEVVHYLPTGNTFLKSYPDLHEVLCRFRKGNIVEYNVYNENKLLKVEQELNPGYRNYVTTTGYERSDSPVS